MNAEPTLHDDAARIVALMVAGGGRIDECQLRALERVGLFRSPGIDRARFIEIAQAYAHDIGSHLCETSWLRNGDRVFLDGLLAQVTDPGERRLVCRLTAAAMAAADHVVTEERMLFDHMLASWRMAEPVTAIAESH
jgi:hypothetical protein